MGWRAQRAAEIKEQMGLAMSGLPDGAALEPQNLPAEIKRRLARDMGIDIDRTEEAVNSDLATLGLTVGRVRKMTDKWLP